MPLGKNSEEFWTATFRREQLLELLEGRGPRPTKDGQLSAVGSGPQDKLIGIWKVARTESVSPLPQVIVGDDKSLDDLFAWSGSYLRELGPISGLVRTLSFDQLSNALAREPPSRLWDVAAGAVGIVVAEVWCRSGPNIGLEEAAVVVPNSTLAYAMLRSWALGFRREIVQETFDRYVKSATILGRPMSADIAQSVLLVVSTLIGSTESRGENSDTTKWWEALRAGVSAYDVLPEVLHHPRDLFAVRDVEQVREMTAEERVKFFDLLAPTQLDEGGKSQQRHAAFALALTAFLCRPGFLQQVTLLRKYAEKVPEAVFWLGALQVLSPMTDTMLLQSGAGWRIARELCRKGDLFAAPTTEASIAEIEKLSGVASKSYQNLVERPRIEIEIYPMIVSSFRGGRDSGTATGHRTKEYYENLSAENRMYSEKIGILETQLEEAIQLVRSMRRSKDRKHEERRRGRRK